MKLEHVQQTFISESRELLHEMESALLRLENVPTDNEALNTAFRAAHTIKGSSGVCSCEPIVDFTHAMESLLHEVRTGNVEVTPGVVGLLLDCCDHVGGLLDCIGAEDAPAAFAGLDGEGAALLDRLGVLQPLETPKVPVHREEAAVQRVDVPRVASPAWHISVRFGLQILRHGMDPLSLIRYLATMGEIVSLTTLIDRIPQAAEMDSECCYLGVEIDFAGDVTKQAIEQVFDYVRDDCFIRILTPHSCISDYIDLIRSVPEGDMRLGEILVASGALTRRELGEGLAAQSTQAAEPAAAESAANRKIGEILVGQGVLQEEIVDAALSRQKAALEHRSLEGSFLRVRADKLDELITLVGELVIASAGTSLAARRAGDAETTEAAANMARLVEEARDRALGLRMVPIRDTFNRFGRVVRDLGRELDKDVELLLSGTETELDKSMVERISDPLMHLVRNAVDHGIETRAVRAERGKPVRGRIQLNAYHETGSIVIEIADDGNGMNRARILERAIERGFDASRQALSDHEVFALVMEPGFSTADAVTNVSGRGVGMDVVRRNVEALRGSVRIESVEGVGSTIAIRLPLTLAIIDGFLVGVGSCSYVVPLEMVVECIELRDNGDRQNANRNYINLRGEVLPLLRLRDVFAAEGEPGRRQNIVVVQYGGARAGFVVDALLGEFQTVIKPLGRLFERLSGVSGSTILGSGEVALILDVQALVQRAVGREAGVYGETAPGKSPGSRVDQLGVQP